mmetsp:Transcript_93746/g.190863  ORF Transcript_93746/g.190863 Transcript_93746/m.190863 type:complete len:100 (+) Transcript_93746:209-508(+)
MCMVRQGICLRSVVSFHSLNQPPARSLVVFVYDEIASTTVKNTSNGRKTHVSGLLHQSARLLGCATESMRKGRFLKHDLPASFWRDRAQTASWHSEQWQ